MGPRAPRRRAPAPSGPPVGLERRGARRAISTTRSSRCAARPRRRGRTARPTAFSLVYSGNFLAEAEVDPFGTTRVRIGIDPETFAWTLEPGAAFTTPGGGPRLLDAGLGAMSDAFHRLYRERLARGPWRDRPRPILINNWEGTYFDFDDDRLVAIADVARDLGVELFVLDDGWFGKRDDDTTSLGDWFVDRRKLPDGIDGLAPADRGARPRASGSGSSPRWSASGASCSRRTRTGRSASPAGRGPRAASSSSSTWARPEVVDHLFGVLSEVLASAPISYVKWDMNRNITEPCSAALPPDRQGEFFHRYILGVYDLYAPADGGVPRILFESCASGGGRFDPGMLAFAPQAWTSDDTDAIERLRDPVGHVAGLPAQLDGRPRLGGANHQVGADHAARDPGGGRVLRRVRLRARPDGADRGRAGRGRRPDRVLQGPPRAVPARPVRPAAQPVRGRRQRDRLDGRRARPRARRSSALPDAQPARPGRRSAAAARPRPGVDPTGSAPGRRATIRSPAPTPSSTAATS